MAGGRKSAGKGNIGNAFVGGNQKLFGFVYAYKIYIVGKASADGFFEGRGEVIVAETAKSSDVFHGCRFKVFCYVDKRIIDRLGHYRLVVKHFLSVPIAKDTGKYL